MKLVIVESPTKAKTIKRFLPKDYVVESSFGHIRDLPQSASDIPASVKTKPWARLGVNIEDNFAPLYIIPKEKKKQVAKLKALLQEADALYLASDEDREGEAISWHLLEVLKPKVPIYRMVFHEITKPAIMAALEHPRELNMHLVEAQETRRVLDRLYGYEVSPILWRKIAPKLSAGRVQSAALQLIVAREQERMRFHSGQFWDITGSFIASGQSTFEAKLYSIADKRLATHKDFDSTTGALAAAVQSKVVLLNATTAQALADRLKDTTWNITDIQQKPLTSSPYPPFITSTLQQEAGRKLGLSASRAMRLAQQLYEKGMITYMRTDSVQLSTEAITAARQRITENYGAEFVPPQPRLYKTKNKLAQEAHEAIRPAGTSMTTPDELGSELDADELRLYELIWKRTIASQMMDAKLLQTTVKLQHEDVIFQANGRVVEFAGYLRAYVEGSDDPEADLAERDNVLPPLQLHDSVQAQTFNPKDHTTQPPARFTEASLVKELEARGVGRPSTYATIIETIQRRGYVYKAGSALIPRFVAFAVANLLHTHFPNLVDTQYTASMEEDLDAIAAGNVTYIPYLQNFYFGKPPSQLGLRDMLKVEIDPRQVCTIPLGEAADHQAVNVRVGRYGPFVEHISTGNESVTASIPSDIAPDSLTVPVALEYIAKQQAGPKQLGADPATGKSIYVLEGRFGPYVQLGEKPVIEKVDKTVKQKRTKKAKVEKPKIKGLLKGMKPEDVTLDIALQLLNLPKVIGAYPKTGEDIIADNGRFGPYLRCGVETRSLSPEDNLLTLTLERAITMFDTPKTGRGRRGKPAVLKELGEYPDTKDKMQLLDGRYGPYLKVGKKNISLPKDIAPDTITTEQAITVVKNKLG